MKFKHLIIIFTIVIIFFLLIITLLPSIIAGPEFAANFRNITLPVSLFMAVLLISMNCFFLFNYRLLSLLEREDWPALAYYLEQKIYGKGQYSARKVRLLASSYLVVSDYSSVLRLESKLLTVRPELVEKNVLIFGAARVLDGNYKEAAVFFQTRLEKGRVKEEQWVRWFYGFSRMLAGAFALAEPEFMTLAVSSGSAFITGLSAYFLFNTLAKHSPKPEECRAAAKKGRDRVVEKVKNTGGWKNEMVKMENEIHVTIVRKYIDQAGAWLFGP
ncbi:MAG: hypothetical protein LBG91_03500 [Treponema sp.]|nr:hypothetical protein [Treponema sp.]